MDRHLDGIYYRVQRNGKWESVCLSDMTKEERRPFLESLHKDGVIRCVDHLCDCLKDIGDAFDVSRDPDE